MAKDFTDWIAIIYICIQAVITLSVSIAGVIYVRREFILDKEKKNGLELQIKANSDGKTDIDSEQDTKMNEEDDEKHKEDVVSAMNKMNFIKLWFKIVWKMRSVYISFAVHVFDVLTDILVILEWWNLEQNGVDIADINARIMAICGIAVLLFHKFITTLAFWMKEKNIIRCILQFLDFLIFEEIYISHKKIVTQFRNLSDKKTAEQTAVETTTSFKFVRNLEAVFESIPQSILQLVFILRTGSIDIYSNSMTLLIISILSIMQSVVSMSNSILKNDNTFMTLPKWKKHKQRLPPTIPFIKHSLCRLSEVISRIGLFALFWTVIGGMQFGIFLGAELFILLLLTIADIRNPRSKLNRNWNIEDIFLRIQALIVLPSELIYAEPASTSQDAVNCVSVAINDRGDFCEQYYMTHSLCAVCFTCCCCYWPAVLLSTQCRRCMDGGFEFYVHPSFRIGTSIMEWLILIIWPLVIDNTRYKYLFSTQHGLYVFIISIICFFVYSQYLWLFPNFELPYGVSVRSQYGYAFNGELEELQRIKLKFPFKTKRRKERHARSQWKDTEIKTEEEYWEMSVCIDGKEATPAMFAMANNHLHIVNWIETEKKALGHQQYLSETDRDKFVSIARKFIDPNNTYFK